MAQYRRPLIPPSQLRPLSAPRPLRVDPDDEGSPQAVYSKRRLPVASVCDQWRVDDEWWRSEVSRSYYQTVLEDGRCVTVFQDLLTRRWFRQNY
jgi:hypothetical protein